MFTILKGKLTENAHDFGWMDDSASVYPREIIQLSKRQVLACFYK